MFGDFYRVPNQVLIDDPKFRLDFGTAGPLSIDLPALGGGRVKLSENNKAVTMDRVFVNYSHFENPWAIDPDIATPGQVQSFDVERYVLGFEKRLAEGLWSVEMRLPLLSHYGYEFPGATPLGLGISHGSMGNLVVSAKRQLWASDRFAAAAGLGVDVPTGVDARVHVLNHVDFTVQNEAVHLLPYLGVMSIPGDRLFWHAFLQLDVATNGNPVDFTTPVNTGTFGVLTEQDLLHADFSLGYWLRRNPDAAFLTGLASLVELHYTTALDDADQFAVTENGVGLVFWTPGNRTQSLDLTVGLHGEISDRAAVRVAGVFPLNDVDKPFDAEVQVQMEGRF